MATVNRAAQIKQKRCVNCMASLKDSKTFYVAASKSCQPDRNLFSVRIKLKEVYSRATTKSISQLQPKHGFCQKNISEREQTQDWYPNEKLVVVPVCLNCRCCSSGCLGIDCIKKDKSDKSLPRLVF